MADKPDTTELEQALPDLSAASAALAAAALLAACGGGGANPGNATPAADPTPSVPATPPPSRRDAARFLAQASFGATGAP